MPQPNDLSKSLVALDQDSTIIAVVELSQAQSGARVPGQGTHPACQPHEGRAGPARHSKL